MLFRRILVCVILILAVGVIHYMVASQVNLAECLNATEVDISGRQRMLVLRIALQAKALVNAKRSPERQDHRHRLNGAIAKLAEAHAGLQHGDGRLKLTGIRSAAVKELYENKPWRLASRIARYQEAAGALAKSSDSDLYAHNPHYRLLQSSHEELIRGLDALVLQLLRDRGAHIAQLQWTAIIELASLWIALGAIGLFIVWPMVNRLSREQARLRQSNTILREQTAEMERTVQNLQQESLENEMFVYSVSHDLRSPLVNLEGFSNELSLSCEELLAVLTLNNLPHEISERGLAILDDDIGESVNFIQTAVRRLSTIIDALLRLSRAGRVQYELQKTDMNALINRVVDAMSTTIAERKAAVRTEPLPPAWGDAAAIEQVFANLIDNAVKYAHPERPGLVQVGWCSPGNAKPLRDDAAAHIYYVKDNGLGIPKAHLSKVFQIFQRLHPQAGVGEGVGLALSRRVVERQGGQIWVESEEGKGSTFYLRLPKPPANEEQDNHGGEKTRDDTT